MSGRGSARRAARLQGVAALSLLVATPALAQPASPPTAPPPTDPGELDPSAPLDPMPGLGVDWPALNAPTEPPPADQAAQSQSAPEPEDGGNRKYVLEINGVG